ncbi:MAG: HNH endonuclease [Eubacterium sp.]|nr:HNH endonuclease [Eubacterium sp.]
MPIEVVAGMVAKEAVKEKAKEVGTKFAKDGVEKSVNISKRVDVGKKDVSKQKSMVDITKRIEGKKGLGVKEVAKELTSKQKTDLLKNGMSLPTIGKCKYLDGIYKLKTQADKLAGKIIPETGVKYTTKTIDLFGKKIEGVFPKFKSIFNCKLPENLLMASDAKQFTECNKQLKEAIKSDPSLRDKFSARQLEQINAGKNPGGYIWHHNEKVGKMELVDSKIHSATSHTGGKAIWGGGKDNR